MRRVVQYSDAGSVTTPGKLSSERSTSELTAHDRALLLAERIATVRSYSQKCLEPNDLSRELGGWQICFTNLDRALVSSQMLIRQELKSGREDLNLRPHDPEPCALAKLSYAPSA